MDELQYRVLAHSKTQWNHQGGFQDYTLILQCEKLLEIKFMRIRTSVFLCVVSRPNFGCFLAPPPLIKSTHVCIPQNHNSNELQFKK